MEIIVILKKYLPERAFGAFDMRWSPKNFFARRRISSISSASGQIIPVFLYQFFFETSSAYQLFRKKLV